MDLGLVVTRRRCRLKAVGVERGSLEKKKPIAEGTRGRGRIRKMDRLSDHDRLPLRYGLRSGWCALRVNSGGGAVKEKWRAVHSKLIRCKDVFYLPRSASIWFGMIRGESNRGDTRGEKKKSQIPSRRREFRLRKDGCSGGVLRMRWGRNHGARRKLLESKDSALYMCEHALARGNWANVLERGGALHSGLTKELRKKEVEKPGCGQKASQELQRDIEGRGLFEGKGGFVRKKRIDAPGRAMNWARGASCSGGRFFVGRSA